jgi:hypothetical protein
MKARLAMRVLDPRASSIALQPHLRRDRLVARRPLSSEAPSRGGAACWLR